MSLFPAFDTDDAGQARDLPPLAAGLAPKLRRLAERGVYFGTSSWKYEGWLGSIYSEERLQTKGKLSRFRLEATCIQAYAEVFPAVGGDFTFYKFYDRTYWDKFFREIPKSLRFGFKVTEALTVARWTKQSGPAMAGQDNPDFLDAGLFEARFIEPLRPYSDRLAPLIFEFGSLPKGVFPTPGDFYARLDPFLGKLPEGYRYSIEIRNAEYLTPEYFDLLKSHNVAHVFNSWTRMPALEEQIQLPGAFSADFTVVRALLRGGRTYRGRSTRSNPTTASRRSTSRPARHWRK